MKRLLALLLSMAMCFMLLFNMVAHAENYVHWGIDVSEWQGTINWTAVKNAGVEFAILRAWCWDKDERFEEYYANAKAVGMPVGAYSYIYANTVVEARAEAYSFLATLSGKQFEYPVFIDVEESKYQSMSASLVTSIVKTQLEIIESAGYYVGVYTGTFFAMNNLNMSELAAYDTWIADYRGYCGYSGAHGMWQYSSSGNISGIAGNVDMNYAYKDYPNIIRNAGLNGFDPSPAVTYPYMQDANTMMLYDGESYNGITSAFNTNLSLNAAEKTQGSRSLQMSCAIPAGQNGNVGGMVLQTLHSSANLSGYLSVSFDLYLSRPMTGSNGFQLNLSTSGEDGFNYTKPINNYEAGWHTITIPLSSFVKVKENADWSNINRLRFTWNNFVQSSDATYFLIDNVHATLDPANVNPNPGGQYPFVADADTLMLYDGESTATLSATYNTSLSLNSTNKTQYLHSLQMTFNNPVGQYGNYGGMMLQTLNTAADLTAYDGIKFDLYLSRDLPGSNGFQINLATSGQDGYNYLKALNNYSAGWHTITIPLAAFDIIKNDANWANINNLRYTWVNYVQSSAATYFLIDNVRAVKDPALANPNPGGQYPFVLDTDTLMLYDGESYNGITSAFNTSLSLNTNKKTQFLRSLQMTCNIPSGQNGNVGGMMLQTLNSSADLTSYDGIKFDLYVSRTMTGSNGFQLNLATSGEDGFNYMKPINNWETGWHTVTIPLAAFEKVNNSANLANINNLRYTWNNFVQSSDATYFLIDNVRAVKDPALANPNPGGQYPFVLNPNTLMLYDGESYNGITSAFNTSLSLNTGKKTQFLRSLQMTCNIPAGQNGNVGGMVLQVLNVSADLTDYDAVAIDLYLSREMTGSNGFQLNLSTSGEDGFNYMKPINNYSSGWHTIVIPKSAFSKVKADADWANINRLRYTWNNFCQSSDATYFLIDNVRAIKTE